jgi:hypothetical protein
MPDYGASYRPEGSGAPRRGLFGRQADEPSSQLPAITAQDRMAYALQRAVDERLEDGLRAIEEHATALMREIASEIWRVSGADVRPEQERIVSLLSRDQAIKGLIASSDERFQSLAVRTGRVEDALADLVETGRATREAMKISSDAIREIADSPTLHGVEVVRTQLEQVEKHIAATFEHLQERDQMLTDNVLAQVRDHGDLIARETTRIVEAMQGYVQGGAEAMGQLAQRVEAHAETFAMRDENVAEKVRDAVGEAVQKVEALVETRTRGVAELIRSDSEALRRLVEDRSAEQKEAVLGALEDKMQAFSLVIESQISSLNSSTQEQVLSLSSALAGAIDRSFARLGDQMDQKLEGVSAAGVALDGVDTMLAESQAAAEDRMMAHIDQRIMAVAKLIRSDNQTLADKVAAMQTGGAAGTDPELMRSTLRAVKELQAELASDVVGSMDRKFQTVSDQLHKETQSTAEAMVKVAEVLGQKMDRLTVRVDQGYGNDVQIVIDRMTDAITALSGRSSRASSDRLDI